MGLNRIAVALAFAGALTGSLALLAAPADAQTSQTKKKAVVGGNGHTVFVSRDEEGRTRTRIIIQRRSYLNPGTEQFPGERSDHEYSYLPTQHAGDVLDNTAFGSNQSALPGPFTLSGRHNPWIGYSGN